MFTYLLEGFLFPLQVYMPFLHFHIFQITDVCSMELRATRYCSFHYSDEKFVLPQYFSMVLAALLLGYAPHVIMHTNLEQIALNTEVVNVFYPLYHH